MKRESILKQIENKELLIKDLNARAPYGVTAKVNGVDKVVNILGLVGEKVYTDFREEPFNIDDVKPILRNIEEHTEEEEKELCDLIESLDKIMEKEDVVEFFSSFEKVLGWLRQHEFDLIGLIPNGLAIKKEL